MIRTLVNNRYRPPFGTTVWIKYWTKRARLFPSLLRTAWANRRLRQRCRSYGQLSLVSPSKIGGNWNRLRIGNHSAIGRVEIQLHADVSIGSCVVINDGCRLLTGSHNIQSPNWDLIAKPIVIEDYAWIATGATLLPGVTIGRGAVVGAGAVVSRSVGPLEVVVGNPARLVGSRTDANFDYRPSETCALFEAWLGPVKASRSSRNTEDTTEHEDRPPRVKLSRS